MSLVVFNWTRKRLRERKLFARIIMKKTQWCIVSQSDQPEDSFTLLENNEM